ncbi:unnamed protein product [Mytilus coruscus]|uniref:DUF6570 domain-containing protein n=1 Tax=Mytilus coruscus TaxID=42192 RepID=A0A6J8EIV3_MYTCO|nr:unnamed protein product [Mytilus coruscus]
MIFLGNFSFQRQKYVLGREVSYCTLTRKIYYQNDFSMVFEFAFNLILSSSNSKFSAILIFCASAISVRKTNNEYYLFDSHSRCRNGLLDPDGACHISKYENLSVLCSFLRDLACSLSSSSLEQIEYEMIRVEVKTSVNARNENLIVFNINVGNQDSGRSSENKSSKELSTLQVTSSSEVLNQRKHVPSSCITKHKDQVTTKIDRLNKKRKQTLSCHTQWPQSVEKLDDNVLLVNNMKFPPIPAELLGLTNIEQRLISPRLTFMTIRQQPRGGQLCMKGNIVNVPADVNKTIRILPRTLDNAETIYVKLKRKISFKHSIAQGNDKT